MRGGAGSKNDPWLYAVAGFLLGLMVFPALPLIVNDPSGLVSGLVPETMSIVVTMFVIERLNESRAKRERAIERKERLIWEAGSPVKDVAVHAIDEIRKRVQPERIDFKPKNILEAVLETFKEAIECHANGCFRGSGSNWQKSGG